MSYFSLINCLSSKLFFLAKELLITKFWKLFSFVLLILVKQFIPGYLIPRNFITFLFSFDWSVIQFSVCTNYYRMKPNCCIVCIPLFLSQNISYINAACNSSPLCPYPFQSCRDWCIVANNAANQNLVCDRACSLFTLMDEQSGPFDLASYRRSALARSFALIVVSVSRFPFPWWDTRSEFICAESRLIWWTLP